MVANQNSSDNIAESAGTVTKISFQKKKTDRRSVFIDGEYAFSISEQTYQLFPLHVNQQLTDNQISVIKSHEEYEKARELALRYISIRMRSEYELTTYLRKKECNSQVIKRVVQYCHEREYLNDTQYAEMLTRDMVNINRYGSKKMFAVLRKRGILSETITQVLREQVDETEQINIAQELAIKKLKTINDQSKAREKLYRYLKQRGFKYSIIAEVVKRLLNY
ncbi:MAG: RecX family transcriptional regulator [Candidatus Marinimicrobia bacterium]|nr:RecX family transcriptional regulator [Candidatus Neomarinimicrobiota bacterium]